MTIDAARLMLNAGLINESDLGRALGTQASRGGSLPRVCRELGLIDEGRWARVLARALALPPVDLAQVDIEPLARGIVSERLLREITAFPFQLRDGGRTLVIAMAEPQDETARAQLKEESKCELKIGVASYRQIEELLDKHPNPNSTSGVSTFLAGAREGEVDFDGSEIGGAEVVAGEPAFADAELIEAPEAPAPAAAAPAAPSTAPLSEEAGIARLRGAMDQGAKALRAAIELCVERGLFSPDELKARGKKG